MNQREDVFEQARQHVEWRLSEIIDEADLRELLAFVRNAARDDSAMNQPPGADRDVAIKALAGVEAWASLASYAVVRFYDPEHGPGSAGAWRRRFAGWGRDVTEELVEICGDLSDRVRAIGANLIGATSFSIGVNFPWGISVSFSWPVTSFVSGLGGQQQGSAHASALTIPDSGLVVTVESGQDSGGSTPRRLRISPLGS